MLAISNTQLEQCTPLSLGMGVRCPDCGQFHETIEIDPSVGAELLFIRCPDGLPLRVVGVKGKNILTRPPEITFPLCDTCWGEREPGREPHRIGDPLEETCGYCGGRTSSGIYYRDHPDNIRFLPSEEKS